MSVRSALRKLLGIQDDSGQRRGLETYLDLPVTAPGTEPLAATDAGHVEVALNALRAAGAKVKTEERWGPADDASWGLYTVVVLPAGWAWSESDGCLWVAASGAQTPLRRRPR